MNTPLLLTSVAFLAGVAARPIDDDRRGDDMRELVHSPDSNDRQALFGRIPAGFGPLNSLQLHDINENARTHPEDDLGGNISPKLTGVDGPSDPDPGLDSPYMGPQRYLANIEQELGSPALSLITQSAQSSSVSRKTEESRHLNGNIEPEYSPMVVPLIFASLAALVLLGLAVAVACVSHVLPRTVLNQQVWRQITKRKGSVSWSETEKEHTADSRVREGQGREHVAARENPGELVSVLNLQSKSASALVDESNLHPLAENPQVIPSTLAVRDQTDDHTLKLAIAAWMYDHWVTHFIMALLGWLSLFLGGARANLRQ